MKIWHLRLLRFLAANKSMGRFWSETKDGMIQYYFRISRKKAQKAQNGIAEELRFLRFGNVSLSGRHGQEADAIPPGLGMIWVKS